MTESMFGTTPGALPPPRYLPNAFPPPPVHRSKPVVPRNLRDTTDYPPPIVDGTDSTAGQEEPMSQWARPDESTLAPTDDSPANDGFVPASEQEPSHSGRSDSDRTLPPPTSLPAPSTAQAVVQRPAQPILRFTKIRHRLVSILVIAVASGFLMYGNALRSLAIAVLLGIVLIVSVWSLQTHRDAIALAAISAAAFLPWLVWRASPWLIAVDLAAFAAIALHIFSRRGSIFRVTLGGYVGQWMDGFVYSFAGPMFLARSFRSDTPSRTRRSRTWLVSAIIPTVIFLIVVGLMAAGDKLFASYFEFLQLDRVLVRLALAAIGVAAYVGAVGASARPERGPDPAAQPVKITVASLPVMLTLAGLAIALAAFAAVQLSAAVLGASYVKQRTGLSYAEWARTGFLAMSVVSIISTSALGIASATAARTDAHRGWIRLWSIVVALGVAAVAASSLLKLTLYADQYGLTMLRVYSMTFTVWLAVVALLQLGSILFVGGRWVTTAVLITALLGAFGMNIANPEFLVMRHNLDRAASGQLAPTSPDCLNRDGRCWDAFDPIYASELSADAVVVGLQRLDDLPIDIRTAVRDDFCGRRFPTTVGWDFNRSINEAKRAQRTYC